MPDKGIPPPKTSIIGKDTKVFAYSNIRGKNFGEYLVKGEGGRGKGHLTVMGDGAVFDGER